MVFDLCTLDWQAPVNARTFDKDNNNYNMKTKRSLSIYIVLLMALAIVGCSTMTPQTRIWRITDSFNGSVYYAKSFQARWHGRAGMFMTATGTTSFTPSQASDGAGAHITSTDSWRAPFSVAGCVATYKGNVTGMAMITASGTEQPDPPSGQGYDSAILRDWKSGKEVTVKRFIADVTMAGDITGLVSK